MEAFDLIVMWKATTHNRITAACRALPSRYPPIAAVGLSESAACAQAQKLRVRSAFVPDWYTARRVAESIYGYKTIVDEGSGRILGAHVVGPHADEVINVFGLAIRHDLSASKRRSSLIRPAPRTSTPCS